MVAYSFKKRFVPLIEDRSKIGTLRNPRARHARPGEQLQLYTAMRTKQCRLIGFATCATVAPIRLDLHDGRVEFPETGNALALADELDRFAILDGFPSWRALVAFWADTHPSAKIWEGVRIVWRDTFTPGPAA